MTSSILDAAVAGDEQAFREVVSQHTRELYLYCYRMLGSVSDAEEPMQDVLLSSESADARSA